MRHHEGPHPTPLAALPESVARLRGRLDTGLDAFGGEAAGLDESAREALLHFVALLAKWNRVHNLTAVRDVRQMLDRHVLDSLAVLPWVPVTDTPPPVPLLGSCVAGQPLDAERPFDLIDVGSGAGLPALPLAIARPSLRCLSIESNRKKSDFQRQVRLELGLRAFDVRQARVETVSARGRAVVSRAFAAPGGFLAVAAPLCAPDGIALVMLGRAERLPEPLPAPFSRSELHALDVPFCVAERHLAICHPRRRPSAVDA